MARMAPWREYCHNYDSILATKTKVSKFFDESFPKSINAINLSTG